MKYAVLYLQFFCLLAVAQDKVYRQDGSLVIGKVMEIFPDIIKMNVSEQSIFLNKSEVVLIEYANGYLEPMTTPTANVVFDPVKAKKETYERRVADLPTNYLSLNTLALCNADFSVFYEHVAKSRKLGAGVMGAFNFNPYVTAPNALIAILDNCKKKYDLGAFANLYTTSIKENGTTMYWGVLFKYMSFRYTQYVDTASQGSVVIYQPTNGSQFATIFTFGTHTNLKGTFFVKTIVGLGGFFMRGTYKKEFNAALNRNSSDPSQTNVGFLPKLYFGFNMGFRI